MKLGFFVTNQYMPHESMEQKILENLEQVSAARDAGFDLGGDCLHHGRDLRRGGSSSALAWATGKRSMQPSGQEEKIECPVSLRPWRS